jgi:hypothetical protein
MQYFFHIRADNVRIPDEEGMELPNISAARAEMRASAMDLAMAAIRIGAGVDARALELEDKCGNIIETLPIRGVLH